MKGTPCQYSGKMVFPGTKVNYTCGCSRDIDTKRVTYCDAHVHQRYMYEELLAEKRRIKESLRQGIKSGINNNYVKRQLCLWRKNKRKFWEALEECPQEEPRAIGAPRQVQDTTGHDGL